MAAVVAAGLTGCSSDEPAEASDTDEGATRADFIEVANDICREANDRSREIADTRPDSMLEANAELIEQAIADLRALPQPDGDEQVLERMYDRTDSLVADARELARLLADPAADADEVARTSEEVEALQRSVNDELTDYGLTECGAG